MHRLTNNWNLKLISLVLAVLLWSHVRGAVNPLETMTVDVPLRARAPRGFVIVNNEALPTKVSVILRGPRLALRDIKGGSLANPLAPTEQAPNIVSGAVRANLDLSKARSGTQSVAIKAESNAPDVEALGTKPASVSVTLDRAEGQSFDVRTAFAPAPDEDMTIQNVRITPPQAIVYGASQSMARIVRIQAQVDGRAFESGVLHEVEANLIAVDKLGNEIKDVRIFPDAVQVRATLREQLITRRVTVRAELRGKPAAGYRVAKVEINPSRVLLRGTRSALAKLSPLSVQVDIGGARERTLQRRVTLALPRGVATIGTRAVVVAVTVLPFAGNSGASAVAPQNDAPPQVEKPQASNDMSSPSSETKKPDETAVNNSAESPQSAAPEGAPPETAPREF